MSNIGDMLVDVKGLKSVHDSIKNTFSTKQELTNVDNKFSEVNSARQSGNGTTYDNLKARLDADKEAAEKDISELKADLKEQDARLLVLDGKVTSEWEIGRRYLNNGAETWASASAMMSTKRGTYINFKSGDVIVLKNLLDYQFSVVYSSDNGSTWSGGTNRVLPMTMDADAIGFICIKKLSGTFTNDEVANVAKNKIFILRGGVNIVSDNEQKIDAITMAMETFNNSEMVSIVSGLMKTWVTANSISVVSESRFGNSITASINDVFAIKVDLSVSYLSLIHI